MCQNSKVYEYFPRVVGVFEEACCTQPCISVGCNVVRLKIMSLYYNRFLQACHKQHCNEVCALCAYVSVFQTLHYPWIPSLIIFFVWPI